MNRMILGSALLALGMLAGCSNSGEEPGPAPAPVLNVKSLSKNRFFVGSDNELLVKFKGERLTGTPKVKLGDLDGTVLEATDSSLKVRLPATLLKGDYPLKVLYTNMEKVADSVIHIVGPRKLFMGTVGTSSGTSIIQHDFTALTEQSSLLFRTESSNTGLPLAFDPAEKTLYYNPKSRLYRFNLERGMEVDLEYGLYRNCLGLDEQTGDLLSGVQGAPAYIELRPKYGSKRTVYTGTADEGMFFQDITVEGTGDDRKIWFCHTDIGHAYKIKTAQLKTTGAVVTTVLTEPASATGAQVRYAFDVVKRRIFKLMCANGEAPKLYVSSMNTPGTWTLLQTFAYATYGDFSTAQLFKYEPSGECLFVGDTQLYRIPLRATGLVPEMIGGPQSSGYSSIAFQY